MSKAFVNEDANTGEDDDFDTENEDGSDDEDGADRGKEAGAAAARSRKNYITQNGMIRLKAELQELLTGERPKLVEVIAWAASNGDRSENADYIYGKRRLREIDRRIRFLQRRLDIAEVVDPATQKGPKVLFGATVTVRGEDDQTRVYRVVGIDETEAKAGKISWISPIGQALLQSSVGDAVVLKTPKGEEELEIEKVEYLPID